MSPPLPVPEALQLPQKASAQQQVPSAIHGSAQRFAATTPMARDSSRLASQPRPQQVLGGLHEQDGVEAPLSVNPFPVPEVR